MRRKDVRKGKKRQGEGIEGNNTMSERIEGKWDREKGMVRRGKGR